MRNALEEKVQERLKNKGKQRMRPKMGKMDIDYSILHDAFFKYQDKPKMTQIGDMYYEGVLMGSVHAMVSRGSRLLLAGGPCSSPDFSATNLCHCFSNILPS
jgi:hypothetical protein